MDLERLAQRLFEAAEQLLKRNQTKEDGDDRNAQQQVERTVDSFDRPHAASDGMLERGVQTEVGETDKGADRRSAHQQRRIVRKHEGLQQQLGNGDRGGHDQRRLLPGVDAECEAGDDGHQ